MKPENKKYSVSDGRGLIIEVRPNGAKYWVIRYWVDRKEKRKHIGSYPEISLKEARVKAVEERAKTFIPETPLKIIAFGEIAEEWFLKRMKDKKPSYLQTIKLRLNRYILPELKDTPLKRNHVRLSLKAMQTN